MTSYADARRLTCVVCTTPTGLKCHNCENLICGEHSVILHRDPTSGRPQARVCASCDDLHMGVESDGQTDVRHYQKDESLQAKTDQNRGIPRRSAWFDVTSMTPLRLSWINPQLSGQPNWRRAVSMPPLVLGTRISAPTVFLSARCSRLRSTVREQSGRSPTWLTLKVSRTPYIVPFFSDRWHQSHAQPYVLSIAHAMGPG